MPSVPLGSDLIFVWFFVSNRNSYKDWVTVDIRQILIQTHGVPSPNSLKVPGFFSSFQDSNFARFSRKMITEDEGDFDKGHYTHHTIEIGFIKLRPEFWDATVNASTPPPSLDIGSGKKPLALASEQSYGFFDDILDDSWERMRTRAQNFIQYSIPGTPECGWRDAPGWYVDNL
jgi:Methyltransferase domain